MSVIRSLFDLLSLPVATTILAAALSHDPPLKGQAPPFDWALFWSAIEAVGTVLAVAVALGIALRERRRERAKDELHMQSLITLLRLEIDQNLELLSEYWQSVSYLQHLDPNTSEGYIQLAQQLVQHPLPEWSRDAWEAQLPLVPRATSDTKIREIYRFYNRLNAVTAIHDRLLCLEDETRHDRRSRSTDPPSTSPNSAGALSRRQARRASAFYREAAAQWHALQHVVSEILDSANPL